jgi:hypothetical protein
VKESPSAAPSGISEGEPTLSVEGDVAVPRPPTSDIQPGEVLAERYEVRAEIGRGGAGVVYQALDRVTRQAVAIKARRGQEGVAGRGADRLFREVRYGRWIQHPHVRRVYDAFEADGRQFVSMEYAPGGSLRVVLGQAAARPIDERIADARAVVAGLAAIHAAGLVHGDFKPENVLRMGDGRLVVSDLGQVRALDRATAFSGIGGTPGYVAPELVQGGQISQAADVWSLGVVLHEVFFGVRPQWDEGGRAERLRVDGGARPTGLERRLERLCAACLALRPSARPRSAAEVQTQLKEAVETEPGWWSPGRAALAALGMALAGILAYVLRPAASGDGGHVASEHGLLVGRAADWSQAEVVSLHAGSCIEALPPRGRGVRLIRFDRGMNPRRARVVDIDIHTGHEQTVPLPPNIFEIDCPRISPNGRSLLFVRGRPPNPQEVMYSEKGDGGDAVPVTTGRGPRWLPSGQEFLFVAESDRLSVGNLKGERVLLPEVNPPRIIRHAVPNERGDQVLLVFAPEPKGGGHLLELRAFPSFARLQSLRAPGAIPPIWDSVRSSYQFSLPEGTSSVWVELRSDGVLSRLGQVPGRTLDQAVRTERGLVLASLSGDVLVRKRFPDGSSQVIGVGFQPRVSPKGDVIFVRKLPDRGRVIMLARAGDRAPIRLTDGPADMGPDLAPDGQGFTYLNSKGSIVYCSLLAQRTGPCRTLHTDGQAQPFHKVHFAPSGDRVAYVAGADPTQWLRTVSLRDGSVRDLGVMRIRCPVAWSSDEGLWVRSDNEAPWTEVSALTGRPTGKRWAPDPAPATCQERPPDGNPFQVSAESEGTRDLRVVEDI